MNIMDYLLNAGLGLTENQANEMELEIRDGIARELEDMVLAGKPMSLHGIPSSVEAPENLAELQQMLIRGAANVVRGNDPATEADWEGQTAAMNHRKQLASELAPMFRMPPAGHQ